MIDLFLSNPNLHLRLWKSSLLWAKPDYIASHALDFDFKNLIKRIHKLTPNAIRATSLTEWLEDGGALPRSLFATLVEYENYTLWYLMAHYARMKNYPPPQR